MQLTSPPRWGSESVHLETEQEPEFKISPLRQVVRPVAWGPHVGKTCVFVSLYFCLSGFVWSFHCFSLLPTSLHSRLEVWMSVLKYHAIIIWLFILGRCFELSWPDSLSFPSSQAGMQFGSTPRAGSHGFSSASPNLG